MPIRQRRREIPCHFFLAALRFLAVGARGGEPYAGVMSCVSHQEIVRRARVLIDERAGEPITIRELCQALGVSERTLRNAFHDVHGVGPKRFVMRIGLEQVRRALLFASQVRGAVTRAATERGFFELGRFAAAYRELFGECPSETVRRAVARPIA